MAHERLLDVMRRVARMTSEQVDRRSQYEQRIYQTMLDNFDGFMKTLHRLEVLEETRLDRKREKDYEKRKRRALASVDEGSDRSLKLLDEWLAKNVHGYQPSKPPTGAEGSVAEPILPPEVAAALQRRSEASQSSETAVRE